MRCLICDATDKWENVDQYRVKKKGMCVCGCCGFVSYPELYKTEEEIKEFYRGEEYRKPPTMANIYTGQRKLFFHDKFLKDTFKEWQDAGITKPVIGEQGAAFGMFLNWCRGVFPDADVSGTELTISYRRNAWHEYNIKLDEDFDTSKKYDLIASYKVAEHQLDADKKVREMIECLKPNGLLYISVPTWFGALTNFGVPGFDIEYFYSTSHINTWSKKLFETMLKKCGAEIIKHDDKMYDDTYLCKRNDDLMKAPPVYENPDYIKAKMKAIFNVWELKGKNKLKECLEAYPNYPDGYPHYYESIRAELDKQGFKAIEAFIQNALENTDHHPTVIALAADLHMRYEKYEKAIEYLNKFLDNRPSNSNGLTSLSHCLRNLSSRALDEKDSHKLLKEASKVMRHVKVVAIEKMAESQNWVFSDNSSLPTPFEKEL
jgi:SAM-dependent methyltransferase